MVTFFLPDPDAPISVPYTVFKEQVAKGNVQAIYSQGQRIRGRFREPVTYPPPRTGEAPSGGRAVLRDLAPSGQT